MWINCEERGHIKGGDMEDIKDLDGDRKGLGKKYSTFLFAAIAVMKWDSGVCSLLRRVSDLGFCEIVGRIWWGEALSFLGIQERNTVRNTMFMSSGNLDGDF
jgi:hypothetical protein